MSLEAITWALRQPIKPAVRKLILIKLADNADEKSGHCFPSVSGIADVCGCDSRTVQRHMKELISGGWVSVIERGGIKDDKRRANVYRLTRGWKGESAEPIENPRHDDTGTPGRMSQVPPAECHPTPGTLPPQPVIEPVKRRERAASKKNPPPPTELIDAYHRHIPWGVQVQKWTADRARALRTLIEANPECAEDGIWDDYFAEAARDPFIRGEKKPRDGQEPFKVFIAYLLRPEVYAQFYESAADRSRRVA